MMPRSASAPGKVVLCGEYAVLDGAPAVCMAVDRRARARISAGETDWHAVVAPGFTELEGRCVSRDGRIEWLQGGEEFRLVDAVLRALDDPPRGPLRIELDTDAFRERASARKIGLGSSAALTAALAAALLATTDVAGIAIDAHRALQGGAGSGADVAAAVAGGLIEYRMHGRAVRPLDWPEGLHFRLLWSGVTASTKDRLARYAAARRERAAGRLAGAAAAMADAWSSADSVLGVFPDYIAALRRFSVDHDLGIFDAGHDRLVGEAAAAGLVYKPCGAGGGDVGILLGRSQASLDDFIAAGRHTVDCSLDETGVRLE